MNDRVWWLTAATALVVGATTLSTAGCGGGPAHEPDAAGSVSAGDAKPQAAEVADAAPAIELRAVDRAGFDALVMAAAVSDFRPATTADTKLERGGSLTLELEATPDILGQIARIARGTDKGGETTYEPLVPRPYLVGFAAETGSLDRAADKLRRKGVDLLVANDVSEPGSGFGTSSRRRSPGPWKSSAFTAGRRP